MNIPFHMPFPFSLTKTTMPGIPSKNSLGLIIFSVLESINSKSCFSAAFTAEGATNMLAQKFRRRARIPTTKTGRNNLGVGIARALRARIS